MPLAYNYIRFSTAEQRKGDSLRRQDDLAKAYAEEKGLSLDESLTMLDLGVSAFKGANAESGALAAFLEAIDNGHVPVGSYLLIESLDRLSRAQVFDALQLFIRIINKGITIVSLKDKIEFSKESLQRDYVQLIVCIVFMSRANEESEMKSHRLTAAWQRKRDDARLTGKVLTKTTPFWLRAKEDRSGHVIDEAAADVVRRIFQMSIDGIGVHRIMLTLNAEGVSSPKGGFWNQSSVSKVLHNRAVIGEATFSSFKNPDGTRQSVEPIPDYYPPVIDKATFFEVQDQIASRNRVGRGKQGDSRNLFKGLLYCGYCGGTMPVFSSVFGKEKKRLSVKLQCMGQRIRSCECNASRWDYFDFQHQFFQFVREFDFSNLIAHQSEDDKASELKRLMAENRSKQEANETSIARLMKMIEASDDVPVTVMKRITELEFLTEQLRFEAREIQDQLDVLMAARHSAQTSQKTLVTLSKMLSDPLAGPVDYWEYSEKELLLRTRVTQQIRSLVKKIIISSDGVKLHGMSKPSAPSFIVEFNNGMTRIVSPKAGLNMKLDFRKHK